MSRKHTPPKPPTAQPRSEAGELAAENGRASSRARGDVPGVRKYNGLISAHPHRATVQGEAVNADFPEDAVPECPDMKTTVADDQLEHERADDGDSEALTRLRARVHEDYARWQRYGPLGRSL
nr:hypothetical protein OG690_20800 [Streptomyces tubercidicus]